MKFIEFKTAIQKQFTKMAKQTLYRVDTNSQCRNDFWDIYLAAYPEGSNPQYKERTEYDCQCCKQFIRNAAGIVIIVDNKLVSIWDIDIGGPYQIVANALSAVVRAMPITNKFVYFQKDLGTDENRQIFENKEIMTWGHFHITVPASIVMAKDRIPTYLSDITSAKDVFKRGLEELTQGAFDTVIELIQQKSLYRGDEFFIPIKGFAKLLVAYDKISSTQERDNYVWDNVIASTNIVRLRNTAMGTLLTDLSNNVDLNKAVRSYEAMVAPANYKRPTALITKSMISLAQKTIEELGLTDSIQRRYAIAEDLTINNILFADRSSKKAMNVFDEMSEEVPTTVQTLSKVEEVASEVFFEDILPTISTLSVMPENSHKNNFVSLIAPIKPVARNMFKWDNNFTWAYNGDVTDSIKQRVKAAGGDVTGHLRCSLSWFNSDDLDIHVIEPDGNQIFYSNKRNCFTGGKLDVDMNVGDNNCTDAVENITWPYKDKMLEGAYKVIVHNYTKRSSKGVGFSVEIECNGELHEFHYPKMVRAGERVQVAFFNFTKSKGITITKSIDSIPSIQNIWGVSTNTFHEVKMLMLSPNYWDGQAKGNKHIFFMLQNCNNEEPSRGFFNEFLKTSLQEHRKVLEILGTKTMTAKSDNQLSGLGFSSTQRNSVLCKLTGKFNRIIRINF